MPASPTLPPMASVAAALLLSGCATLGAPDAVATFASRSVECSELQAYAREQGDADATASDLVERYVVDQMLAAEARRIGLARDPETVGRMRAARRDTLLEASEAQLAGDLTVSEEDVAALYEARANDLNRPEQVVTRIILRKLPANASRRAVAAEAERLRDVQAQFLSGVAFADLAVQHSEHPSASIGGTMEPWARGEVDPALQRVVDGLERGEVSGVVRLADGLALILLEDSLTARKVPFADVAVELRGELLGQRRAERRAAAIATARERFGLTVDDTAIVSPDAAALALPVATIGEDTLTLAALGLAHRPPFLRDAVRRAIDDELLIRAAEADAPPLEREQLDRLRREVLGELAVERLMRDTASDVDEAQLRDLYERQRDRFTHPERRVLEVVRVAAESGNLRDARAAAEALRRIWSPGGPIHQRNRAEVWGPIDRASLAAATSEEVARVAFSLDLGETSEPLLVEPPGAGAEIAYALLRPYEVVPAGTDTYAEARDEVVEIAAQERAASSRGELRNTLLRRAGLRILPPLFACELGAATAPPSAPLADEDADESR